jgi:multidrug resistance efflux pump
MTGLRSFFVSGWYVRGGVALLTLGVVASALVARNTIVLSSGTAPVSSDALVGLVRPGEVTAVTTASPFTATSVEVRVGDEVVAGQSLIRIDSTDAQRALDDVTVDLERARQEALERSLAVSRAQQTVAQFDASADAAEAVTLAERDMQQVPTRQVKDSTERAAAALDQAFMNLQRSEQLAAAGLVARQQADEAQLAFRLALDDFGIASKSSAAAETLRKAQQTDLTLRRNLARATAQQQLVSQQAMARQAGLVLKQVQARFDEASARLADPFIKAPRGGVVTEILAHPGDRVSAGSLVARLAVMDPVQVDVDVTPVLANALSVGGAAQVDIAAVSLEQAAATVSAIAPLPSDNGKYLVQLSLANPGRARLAGLAADVTFTLATRK